MRCVHDLLGKEGFDELEGLVAPQMLKVILSCVVMIGAKRAHEHKDPANKVFWNPPTKLSWALEPGCRILVSMWTLGPL